MSTLKPRRRKKSRRTTTQFLVLLAAVVVVVVLSVVFQQWWNNRPGPDPRGVTITAEAGGTSTTISPYQVCSFGHSCAEGTIPEITVDANQAVKITVPKEVSRHDWTLLRIYDNPAANDEHYFRAGEQSSAAIPATVDPVTVAASSPTSPNPAVTTSPAPKADTAKRPKLLVIEVHSVMVGPDDNGEQAPLAVVWSVKTNVTGDS